MVHSIGPHSHHHSTWEARLLHKHSTHQMSPIDLQDWRMEFRLDRCTASEKDPANKTADTDTTLNIQIRYSLSFSLGVCTNHCIPDCCRVQIFNQEKQHTRLEALYLPESLRFHFGSCNVQKTIKIGVQESARRWSWWWWYSCCNSSASSSCCCWNIIGNGSCSSAFYSRCSSSIKPVSASSLPRLSTVTLHICYSGRMRCLRRSWPRVGMPLMLILSPAILPLIL